ncbi:MAG: proprotein convertase P-domain-containing protein [Candidatus Nealsonbacteria bacterium]|nr:proprotein convertase P-domain-containing protein [Candidatus Nealsonbacteria bacterium]
MLEGVNLFCRVCAAAAAVLAAVSPAAGQPPGGDRSGSSRADVAIRVMRGMDANRNGHLEPKEISDRARPYIERYARMARLDMSRPMPIRPLEDAARRHHASEDSQQRKSGSSAPTVTVDDDTVPGFGQVENLPPIPGFGTDDGTSVDVEPDDLRKAEETIRRYDRNHNGMLERAEAAGGRWSDDPFAYDKNGDNRMTRQEMAQRYAVRRSREQQQQANSSSSQGRPGPGDEERRRREEEQRRREAEEQRRRAEEERKQRYKSVSRETWGLAFALLARYDKNKDGMLDRAEARPLKLKFAEADTDGQGRIDKGEFGLWLHGQVSKPGQDIRAGLPDWFVERDLNGDGQVRMAEFADEWTELKAGEFEHFDSNGDGIIMPDECLKVAGMFGGELANNDLKLIPIRGTVYSDVTVEATEPIGDLDVQLSITHTHDSSLDAFLIAPDGERIELFTAVGGEDDHFQNTILDDEATRPITEGRPPFAGRYRPEAVAKRQTSLKDYYGKSIEGTWTLMIRASRSDRPGALHGWSLIAKPPGPGSPSAEQPGAESPREPDGDERSSSRGGQPPWSRDRDRPEVDSDRRGDPRSRGRD